MLGTERAEVEARPLLHARRAADELDAVVLLKGRHTLVVEPDGRVRVTTTGVPWLATAGAGDVLAGLVGALLAAGLDPFDAASVGSWLHGVGSDPGLARRADRGRRRRPAHRRGRAAAAVPPVTAARRAGGR